MSRARAEPTRAQRAGLVDLRPDCADEGVRGGEDAALLARKREERIEGASSAVHQLAARHRGHLVPEGCERLRCRVVPDHRAVQVAHLARALSGAGKTGVFPAAERYVVILVGPIRARPAGKAARLRDYGCVGREGDGQAKGLGSSEGRGHTTSTGSDDGRGVSSPSLSLYVPALDTM